jgi:signal transduction histidine kinase/ActR/RegA family two-component response regulator
MTVAENLNILLIEGGNGIARALLSRQTGFTLTHADRVDRATKASGSSQVSGVGGYAAILIDLSLSDFQPGESFRRVSALFPGLPVVALQAGEDPAQPESDAAAVASLAEAIIAEGAQACLPKDGLDGRALALALRQAVLRGRAEARRFRIWFDSAPIGILLAAGRRILMANPAALRILGLEEKENDFSRRSVLDFFPPQVRPELERALDAEAADLADSHFTVDLIQSAGSAVRCRISIAGATLNNSPAVALYLVATETAPAAVPASDPVRAVPEAEQEHRRQARKMEALGRLAGGVSHDFNNLLTAINGYSEHLLSMPGVEGPLASGLKAIRRAGETAATLTRNLMSFSRSESAEARAIPVDEAIREMTPMLQNLLGARVEFRLALEAGKAAARMEPGQLEQMILNLCVNAGEAMAGSGALTIATDIVSVQTEADFTHLGSGLGEYIAISVEDTGVGMAPETLESLFEPFYTTKQGGRGTGLGLATVYAIVSQASGGIKVTSILGEGTRFRIYLARNAVEAAPRNPAQTPASAWQGRAISSETVLVVEDEPSLREMLIAILSRYGFTVLEAASAGEAMDIVTDRPEAVDVVVTDVMLRGEGGHELAESLQAIKPGLRMVFISGHSLETLAERDIILPAEAFLEKPFSPAQLAAKVRSVLDTARKISE